MPQPETNHVLWLDISERANANVTSNRTRTASMMHTPIELIAHATGAEPELEAFKRQIARFNAVFSVIVLEFNADHYTDELEDKVVKTIHHINHTQTLNNLPICIVNKRISQDKMATLESKLSELSVEQNRPLVFLGSRNNDGNSTVGMLINFAYRIADIISGQKKNENYYTQYTAYGCLNEFKNAHRKRRGFGLFHWRTNIFSNSSLEHILFNATRDKKSLSQEVCIKLGWLIQIGDRIALDPDAPHAVKIAYENRKPHPRQAARLHLPIEKPAENGIALSNLNP